MNHQRLWLSSLLALAALMLAGCGLPDSGPRAVQGSPAMVNHAGKPRVWVLSKQEEQHFQTGVRSGSGFGPATVYRFRIQAFDPVAARPVWERTVLTLREAEKGGATAMLNGATASGRLMGQDGDLVWLLVGPVPMALDAADGSVKFGLAGIEQRNPELRGLFPGESNKYDFDRGLVLLSADARRFVIRGPDVKAEPYTPPEAYKRGESPFRPDGSVISLAGVGLQGSGRHVDLDGRWLGLYDEKEAAEAGNDGWGENLRKPDEIFEDLNHPRRTFWQGRIVAAQRGEEQFDRLADLMRVPGTPTFLEGRFLRNLMTWKPVVFDSPTSVLVWHRTRIDLAGRLALTKVSADLKSLWTAVLPISDNGSAPLVVYWMLPGHIVAMGVLESRNGGIQQHEPYLVSVALADGSQRAWNIERVGAVSADDR